MGGKRVDVVDLDTESRGIVLAAKPRDVIGIFHMC